MFQRDRATQVISCDPWSTGLCPYPSLIRKLKTYLELEGKLGPKSKPQLQPHTSTPSHNNSLTRITLVPKKAEKKRRARAPVKRRYKPAFAYHPNFTHEPNPTCCTYYHSSHFYCNHSNAHGEISSHIHSSDCI